MSEDATWRAFSWAWLTVGLLAALEADGADTWRLQGLAMSLRWATADAVAL